MPLNDNQRRFIALYRATTPRNATRAYEAVYKARGHVAEQAASRLLRNVEVEAVIAEADAADLRDLGITAAAVLRAIAQNAFSDVRQLYDAHGALLPVHQLQGDIAMAVAGVEVVETMTPGPDGEKAVQRTHKIRLWNKGESLKLLAQYLKLLTETVTIEHTGEVLHTWQERLTQGHAQLEARRRQWQESTPAHKETIMSDYEAQLEGATQRLGELRTFDFMRVAQGESPPPAWLTTDEGERFLAALERVDVEEAVTIYAAALARASDAWTNLLLQACWPAKEEAL